MAFGRVAERVQGLDGGVDRGGETDGVVGAHQVVVDGAGTADDAAVPSPRQGHRAVEGAVAADGDQGVDAVFFQHVGRLLQSGFGAKLLAAAAVQQSAAELGEVGDGAEAQQGLASRVDVEVFVEQPLISAADADHFVLGRDGAADHRSKTGIHPRGVAAAAKNADPHRHFSVWFRRIRSARRVVR